MRDAVARLHTNSDILSLPALCDGLAACALYGTLQDLMARQSRIRVDGSAVERIGTAVLQVLMAADRAVARSGGGMMMVDASPVLLAAMDDLDLVLGDARVPSTDPATDLAPDPTEAMAPSNDVKSVRTGVVRHG